MNISEYVYMVSKQLNLNRHSSCKKFFLTVLWSTMLSDRIEINHFPRAYNSWTRLLQHLPSNPIQYVCKIYQLIKFKLQAMVQDEQLYMGVCFWYLVKRDLSRYSSVHLTFLQGTRTPRPYLSGPVVGYEKVSISKLIRILYWEVKT